MATFYKIPTEIHNTWIWNSSEPLYFKWWADLQYMASYTNREYLAGNEIVNLKPGQLVASIDFLVKRWGKSKNMMPICHQIGDKLQPMVYCHHLSIIKEQFFRG